MLKRLGMAVALAVLATASIGLAQPVWAGNNKDLTLVPTHGELADKKVYDNSYALLVGINNYANLPSQIQLHFAVADAMSMRETLIKYYGFPPDHIKMLLNGEATKEKIEQALSDYADQDKYHTDDRVLIYFSGHGQTVNLPGGGQMGFLIPSDAKVEMNHIENAAPYLRTCVGMDNVWNYLQSSPAKHVLLIADACYSGILAQKRALDISPGALAAIAAKRALQVMTAGSKGETSEELDHIGHGAFTYKLLEELKADAAVGPGNVITSNQIYASVLNSVATLTNGAQDPQFGNYNTEGSFLFITTKAQKVPELAQVADNDTAEVQPQPQPEPQPEIEPEPQPAPRPKPLVHPTTKPHPSTSTKPHHAPYNRAALDQFFKIMQNGQPDPSKVDDVTAELKAALDAGADPNGSIEAGGADPVLVEAVSYECMPAIKLLLEYGANPNAVRTGGDTPLSISGMEGHFADAILKQYGAKGSPD